MTRTASALMTSMLASIVLSISACSNANAEAEARALRLPKERLARLFCEVQAVPSHARLGADEIPAALRDIQAQYVMREGQMATVDLAGSFDDKVFLRVSGLGKQGRKEIGLAPGELGAYRVLWTAADAACATP